MTPQRPEIIQRDGRLVIRIPMEFRHRGGRKEVIVPQGLGDAEPKAPVVQQPLALAIARGHRWAELLESGRYASVETLATDVGVDAAYVRRFMTLTLLRPEVIEAILDGREPDGMSLEQLTRSV